MVALTIKHRGSTWFNQHCLIRVLLPKNPKILWRTFSKGFGKHKANQLLSEWNTWDYVGFHVPCTYIYIYVHYVSIAVSEGKQLPKGIYSLVFQRGSRISPFFKNLDWTSEFTLLFFITYIMSKFRRFSGEESIRDLSVLVPTLNIEASSILFRLPLWRRAGLGQGHRVDEFLHSHGTWPGCRLIFTDQLWFSMAMWNYQSAGKSMSLLHDSWDPFVGKPSTKRSKQHSALWHPSSGAAASDIQ
jgi:hypothetical protein